MPAKKKKGVSRNKFKDIAVAAQRLADAASAAQKSRRQSNLDKLDEAKSAFDRHFEKLGRTAALEVSRALVAPPPQPTASMAEFFQGVASAFVGAQTELDKRSAEYLEQVSGQSHILPSVFRIPKVSAEVKFGIEQVDSHSVGLIFFKDETQLEVKNQQSVQFEIVAAPPPPEMPRSPNSVGFVLGKNDRLAILTKVSVPPWTGDENAVLIYQIATGQFLLAYAKAGAGNIGLWYVPEETVPVVLRAFGAAGAAAIEPARVTVFALGAKQRDFLALQ
jgi:hypothetical protein